MTTKDTNQLRTQLLRNGYAVDAGVIDTHRSPDARWAHTHLAIIRVDAPKDFTSKVFAVADEPAAIVGVSPTSAVMLFRVDDGGRYDASTYPYFRKEVRNEFVLDGKKQCFFAVTSTAQTTHRSQLPPLFLDSAPGLGGAIEALLKEAGGRWGPLEMPKTVMELRLEKARAERAAREAAGIVEEEDTPESTDEKLVAANPKLRATDGPIGVLVHEARRRVDARNEATREEKKRQAQEKKDADKRAKDMAAHVGAST